MKKIVKKAGEAYYFSHETIKNMESGKIKFVDVNGNELKPIYFGAGMNGMNGVLKAL